MGRYGILLLGICIICIFAEVRGGVWLGKTLVTTMCKRNSGHNDEQLPIAFKDGPGHGKKECEWISWSRCPAGEPCKLLQKNHCESQSGNVDTKQDIASASAGYLPSPPSTDTKANEQFKLDYYMLRSVTEEIKLPYEVDLQLDAEKGISGSIQLLETIIGGFDKMDFHFRYHPTKFVFFGTLIIPDFRITGNYSCNIDFKLTNGRAKSKKLDGYGHIDLKIPNLKMINVTGLFAFVEHLETYQLSIFYPSKQTTDAWQGIWEGARLDGKSTNLEEISKADAEFGSQLIPELLRLILNMYIPRNLTARRLDLMFSPLTRYANYA